MKLLQVIDQYHITVLVVGSEAVQQGLLFVHKESTDRLI